MGLDFASVCFNRQLNGKRSIFTLKDDLRTFFDEEGQAD